MRRLLLLVVVSALALAGCGNGQSGGSGAPSRSAASASTAVPELVGEWQRTQKCSELVKILTNAGMQGAILEMIAGDGFIPGVSEPGQIKDPAHPCRGAPPRKHSHFFTADGQFGSKDANGEQVDDGTYRLVGDDTVVIGDVTFHYVISGHDMLALDPVIPDCAPNCFEARWSVAVAYPGYTWHRIA